MNFDELVCESELYKNLEAFAIKVFTYLKIDCLEYPFVMQENFLMAVRRLNGKQLTYRFSKEPFGFVGERYLIDCFVAEQLIDHCWQIILMESMGTPKKK